MAIRAWHLDGGFLCDRGPSGEAVVSGLIDEIPEGPWRDLRDYVQFDASSALVREYPVGVYSIEEELTVTAFAVLGAEFRELTVRTFHGTRYRVTRDERLVLAGLREVTDPKTLEQVSRALENVRKRQRERAADETRQGEARVASIPGSMDDPGLGKDYLRAQDLLRDRVRAYGNSRDSQLLEILGRFGALARALGNPLPRPLDLATRHYIEACRHAAFDSGVKPTADARLDVASPPSQQIIELRERLRVLSKGLSEDAEGQELADALNNAACFRRAADCIDRALKHLGA